jgi:pyruvate dehydrogenase E1 component
MPNFWEFPTVSMGLSSLLAIYQARINRYLAARGILKTDPSRVWCFLGDGETDEPESLGAISLAAREQLDNLIFVVNCNLQRLDGPVRGNGKIIQELEAIFRGAGWNVIKVVWGSDWDPLLAKDSHGLLVQRMGETVDGQYQKYSVSSGDYIRKDFFGVSPELSEMVKDLSDKQIQHLRRGGHDPDKVHAAYHAAVRHRGQPTVILAKTIKGYGLGEAGEGRNITHQQKKLNEEELRAFRDRFEIPISDRQLADVPFYRPDAKSPEIEYLLERRRQLGGFLPERRVRPKTLPLPPLTEFSDLLEGTREGRKMATTMAFARVLNTLLRDKQIGRRIVPIIPDEARTFGMDPFFKTYGIYSPHGQRYEPVDKEHLYYYRECPDGQILEEGITEAGSMASFSAAGTAYATHGEPMIPFFIFYSMFGFQRIGDLIWSFGDLRGRGFLLGATAGRTTLSGEGLQHQDGHSHLLAATVPNIKAYHPAFAYEIAVIIRDGLKRMYEDQEDVFYYLTLENETYEMPSMPAGVENGILEGLYLFRRSEKRRKLHVHLFGSSAILREVLRAQEILQERYACSADVWSATSYQQLRREALEVERWNLLHPEASPRVPRVVQILGDEEGPFIAAGDWIKAIPDQIARWVPGGLFSLGTDGFGRSESREALRRFFEVDAESIALAALYQLSLRGKVEKKIVAQAVRDLGIDPEKSNPMG